MQDPGTARDPSPGGLDATAAPEVATRLALYRHLVRARVISARMVSLQRSERIGFHASSIGEEAAIVGSILATRPQDWVFPGARDWYAALGRGATVGRYVHHAFGSSEDPASGHAAPDHMPARDIHVVPPSGVVGAHLPQAVGAAWAAKIRKDKNVGVLTLFGSAVAETGDFHNALNFAGVVKAPVVFAARTTTSSSSPSSIAGRAVAYGLASARVSGGDVFAVHEIVRAALARADAGGGATLLQLDLPELPRAADGALRVDDPLDLGPSDPLVAARERLRREHVLDAAADAALVAEVQAELEAAITSAERAGRPEPPTIFDHVYANVPAHLAAQRARMGGS